MKKILLTALLLLGIALGVEAQTNAGNFVVGGAVNFSSSTTSVKTGEITEKSPAINALVLTPSFSYFLIDNLVLGVDLSWYRLSLKESGKNTDVPDYALDIQEILPFGASASVIDFKPHVAYYFDLSERVKPYAKVGAGVSSLKLSAKEGSSTTSTSLTGFSWSAGVGVATFLNANVALNTQLTYRSAMLNKTIEGHKLTLIPSGLDLSVGFSVFF